MARYTGPKDRLSRREGFDLFNKGAAKLTRLNVPPGQHGPKRQGRVSEYGRQLREKQKVKRMYGLMEKQFRRYVKAAMGKRGNTSDQLFSLLETRLDNVVFRLGFANTRTQARQMVSHKHVLVNGEKVNIPSYHVAKGDSVSLTKTAMEIPSVKKLLQDDKLVVPDWLKRKAVVGKIERMPVREDVAESISDQDVIEFYSRQ